MIFLSRDETGTCSPFLLAEVSSSSDRPRRGSKSAPPSKEVRVRKDRRLKPLVSSFRMFSITSLGLFFDWWPQGIETCALIEKRFGRGFGCRENAAFDKQPSCWPGPCFSGLARQLRL